MKILKLKKKRVSVQRMKKKGGEQAKSYDIKWISIYVVQQKMLKCKRHTEKFANFI